MRRQVSLDLHWEDSSPPPAPFLGAPLLRRYLEEFARLQLPISQPRTPSEIEGVTPNLTYEARPPRKHRTENRMHCGALCRRILRTTWRPGMHLPLCACQTESRRRSPTLQHGAAHSTSAPMHGRAKEHRCRGGCNSSRTQRRAHECARPAKSPTDRCLVATAVIPRQEQGACGRAHQGAAK